MPSGGKLFTGESVSDILAAVLRAPIEFNNLPPETPASIQLLLCKCLSCHRKTRLQHIGDARLALERAITEPEPKPAGQFEASAGSRGARIRRVLAACGRVLLSAALAWSLKPSPTPAPTPTRRVDLVLSGQDLQLTPGCAFALSPDGGTPVSVVGEFFIETLHSRALGSGAETPIPGTSGAYHPSFLQMVSRSVLPRARNLR